MAEPALRLEGAAVALGGNVIWSGVDLTIAEGEFVAVLGPNGAGKSTLLRAILGLTPLDRGRIEVLGSPVRRGNPAIGYLPQRRDLDPDLRIRGVDLVRLGLEGARWGFPLGMGPGARAAARRVREVVAMVGAEGFAERSIGLLSGGERQRLLIAQALVADPRLLILDEPLESLDLANQQAISVLVRDICRARGVTVLLVAHDVNPILPFIDTAVYVANGTVLAGPPEAVINAEALTRLYGTPIDVLRTRDGRLLVIGQPEAVSYHEHGH